MILNCQNIYKSFGEKNVLTNVSFHIEEHEKAAIVGINGAGKSTLLKIIMNEISCDSGNVVISKNASIGYLSQHQDHSYTNTIYEEMLTVKREVIELEERIRALEEEMKNLKDENLNNSLNTYTSLNHRFELLNGYAYKSEIVGVLKGLGFSEEDFPKKISTLSGGQKTRVALGRLLLSNPEIIMLDEPTNHLDMDSISWLETFLSNYKGSVIIVSHDRYFLDKIVTKVIELDNSLCTSFSGNYSAYGKKRKEIRENKLKAYINQQKEIKHQEEVITKLKSFNREKSIKRAESREKMLDKIQIIEKPIELNSQMRLTLEPSVESGNDVMLVEGLTKSFNSTPLFSNLEIDIKRGEKVALIGKNGTGKTTILKIINKQLPKDAGKIFLGSKVKIGYYDQEHQVLSPEKTIFQEISDSYPDLSGTRIRNVLAAFLFTGDDVFKLIKDLSGGEHGRVSLAKLMLSSANFLILDEPTNHLDINSKEILESAISGYTGTVFFVSHDRYFINKTATRIIVLENSKLESYKGNYDYYLEKRITNINSDNIELSEEVSENKNNWQKSKEEQAKERKKANDLKKLEEHIAELENESQEIDKKMDLPENISNTSVLLELTTKKADIESKLSELYQHWEELAE